MLKLAGTLICALALVSGCSAPSKPAARSNQRPPDWDSGAPVTVLPSLASPPAGVTSSPPAVTMPRAGTTWISANRWLAERGLAPLRRVVDGVAESFLLVSPQGMLTLTVGTLVARWDGMELRLGFAPQLIEGALMIHVLDLQKNVEPLLRGFAPITKSDRLVVIDPGHGGSNLGTSSANDSRTERHYTLDWAQRLAPLLRANGWRVLLTRTNDVDVSLTDRVAFTEANQADLFISLHFNSSGNGNREASGLETFCLTPLGMESSLVRGEADDPAQLYPNNAYDESNLMFAVRLHASVLRATGQTDRGVRRARFLTVLRGQNRPAVLLEGGFLSNPAEARRVADPAFRQRLAEAVAAALK